MTTEELKEGDLVEHLASGERGVITDEETSCVRHQSGPFSCVGHPASCDYQPAGIFSLSLGFEKELRGVPRELLRKVNPVPTIKTVCMWCETVTTDGPEAPLSHGICIRCIPDFLKRGGVSDEKIKEHMEGIANGN